MSICSHWSCSLFQEVVLPETCKLCLPWKWIVVEPVERNQIVEQGATWLRQLGILPLWLPLQGLVVQYTSWVARSCLCRIKKYNTTPWTQPQVPLYSFLLFFHPGWTLQLITTLLVNCLISSLHSVVLSPYLLHWCIRCIFGMLHFMCKSGCDRVHDCDHGHDDHVQGHSSHLC